MNILQVIKIVPALVPLIINFVRDLEGIFPDGKIGSSKLELLKSVLVEICDSANIAINDIWPLIERIVSLAVSIFNIFGIFKK